MAEKYYISNVYNPKVINDVSFLRWIATNTRTQITRTFYDVPLIAQAGIVQQNLRKRVKSSE